MVDLLSMDNLMDHGANAVGYPINLNFTVENGKIYLKYKPNKEQILSN